VEECRPCGASPCHSLIVTRCEHAGRLHPHDAAQEGGARLAGGARRHLRVLAAGREIPGGRDRKGPSIDHGRGKPPFDGCPRPRQPRPPPGCQRTNAERDSQFVSRSASKHQPPGTWKGHTSACKPKSRSRDTRSTTPPGAPPGAEGWARLGSSAGQAARRRAGRLSRKL